MAAILAAGAYLWSSSNRRHSVAKLPPGDATPAVEPSPRVPDATPLPRPAAAERTVTVTELAGLVGKGPLREPIYLIGDFVTTSSQTPTAILRPSAESSGPLAREVRIVADYAENATLPDEGQRVTWTAATRCRILVVRRGNDGQINVDLRVEAKRG